MINKLEIKCDFESEGCNEVCPLSNLASHVKTCPFSEGVILCEYGCGIKFPRRLGHSCLQKTVKELKDQLEDQSRTVSSLQESVSLLMTRLSVLEASSGCNASNPTDSRTHGSSLGLFGSRLNGIQLISLLLLSSQLNPLDVIFNAFMTWTRRQ